MTSSQGREARQAMSIRHLLRLLISFCLSAFGAAIPASAAEESPGIWAGGILNDTLPFVNSSGQALYWAEAQGRYFDIGSGVNQYLLRGAVGYKLRGSLQAWVGYGRFRVRGPQGSPVDENRFFQQLNWSAGQVLGGDLNVRARLLQRAVTNGDDTALVLRLLLAYSKPLSTNNPGKLLLRLEPFYDLRDTDWNGKAGLTQNRIYAGLSWHLSETIALETGYMNQFLWRDTARNLSNHLAVINFRMSL